MLTHEDPKAARALVDIEPPHSSHSVRTTYRRLRMGGLTATEAGNLTAHLSGLQVVPHGWRIEEVERLLFVRELARLGRIGS